MDNYPAHVLYSFRRCPYAMRARMALYYAGINPEIREVDLKNKPKSLLTASPKATVPVLILNDATVIDESLDIIDWALMQNDPDGWNETNPTNVDNYNREIMEDFIPNLNRSKYPDRYPNNDPEEANTNCEAYLTKLNARLVKNSGYLCGHRMSKSDIIVFPFIRQYRLIDENIFDRLPLPALHRWISEFYRSEMYNEIMNKFDPWVEGDAPVLMYPEKPIEN